MEERRLKSLTVGAVPIVNGYMERLGIGRILSGNLAGNGGIPSCEMLLILLRNLVIEREPIYGISEWASGIHPSLLNLTDESMSMINDDRMGRSLDALFSADRASMLTEIAVCAMREFRIGAGRFHNDTTTITFSGEYEEADGSMTRGKKTPKIARGHNKDHRPDLKQLLMSLTVSSDGSVPVHYRIFDGNTQDVSTHIEMWECVCRITGKRDFIYVADSKLCVSGTMRYMSEKGGRFITVLPATRREEGWFRDYLQKNKINWIRTEIRCSDDKFMTFESPLPSAEGYRIIWVWSAWKAEKDQDARGKIMEKAVNAISSLNRKLSGRSRIKTREDLAAKADLLMSQAKRYLSYTIHEEETEIFRQSKRGRPGPDTVYVRSVKKRFRITTEPVRENIAYDERCDGMFPLITNTSLTPEEVLQNYKYQPRLEKRNEQMKSVYSIMPMLFKRIDRIEAFLFIFFIAMLIEALIERSVRLSMKTMKIESIPIYHERKECESPTADRLLSIFSNVQFHRLLNHGKADEVFQPELSGIQGKILKMMEIDPERYVLPD